jgi:hypothetical protein
LGKRIDSEKKGNSTLIYQRVEATYAASKSTVSEIVTTHVMSCSLFHSVSVVEFSAMEYAKKENTNPAPGELRPQCESERRADQTGPATLCDVLPPSSVKADHSVALC